MPTLVPYRLFVSHAWRYSERYERMIHFLDAANNFTYKNYSVPEDKAFGKMNETQLQEELREQIRPAQVVIIISGMYVTYSNWIQFEIEYARNLDKPILGIRPWGAQVMPKAVSDVADEIVNWNTNSIVNAIRRLKQ